jgi:hypothetical protein
MVNASHSHIARVGDLTLPEMIVLAELYLWFDALPSAPRLQAAPAAVSFKEIGLL